MFFYNLINSTGWSYNRSTFSGAGFILFLTKLYKNLFEAYAVAGEKKKMEKLLFMVFKVPVLAVAVQWWSGRAGWWWLFESPAAGSVVSPAPAQLPAAGPEWSSIVPALQELPPGASPPGDHTPCVKHLYSIKSAWIFFVGVNIKRWELGKITDRM